MKYVKSICKCCSTVYPVYSKDIFFMTDSFSMFKSEARFYFNQINTHISSMCVMTITGDHRYLFYRF